VSPVSPISVEAHLLHSPGEPPLPSLYGHTLRLRLVARVRAERKFPSVAALVEQIGKDSAEVAGRLGVTR
jgi:FAD synthase